MAALLNLANDGLWGGGSAADEEKPGPDQRVLAELLGAASLTLLSRRREKPGK